tara:strand:+ start:205 stop:678 length:474 start_codon:yes stop_codon:yes gene_type:complete
MAYFIFNNDGLIEGIAADDTAKSKLNIDESKLDVRTVSDADYNKVRKGLALTVKVVNNAVVIDTRTDKTEFAPDVSNDNYTIKTQGELDGYIKNVIQVCKDFLNANADHSMYSDILNYKNYLESFDTSSLTYPLSETTWEEYCDNNSITYYHPLQIP